MPTRFVIVCQVNYSALGGPTCTTHSQSYCCAISVLSGEQLILENARLLPPFAFFMDDILDYSNLKHCHLPAFQKAKYLDPVQKAEDEKA